MILLLFLLSFNRSEFHRRKTECFLHREYQRFITYADSLLEHYPKESDIWLGLIDAYHYLNDEDGMIRRIKEFLRTNHRSFLSIISRLSRPQRRHLIPEVVTFYRRLIRDPLFYSENLYRYYKSAHKYREAVEEMVKAVEASPERLQPLWSDLKTIFRHTDSISVIETIRGSRCHRGRDLFLAMLAFTRGDYNESARLFLRHNYTKGLIKVCEIMAQQGRVKPALRLIRKLEGVSRDQLAHLFFLATDYNSALDLFTDPIRKGECLLYLGRYQEAIEILKGREGAKRLTALAYFGDGDTDRAIAVLGSDDLAPPLRYLKARLHLARSEIKIGYDLLRGVSSRCDDDLANDCLRFLLMIEKVNFDTIIPAHYARADLYYEIKDYDRAIEELRQIQPPSEYGLLLLAKIYERIQADGWLVVTIKRFEREFPDSPLLPRVLLLKIEHLVRRGRRREAKEAIDSLLLRFPGSPEASRLKESNFTLPSSP